MVDVAQVRNWLAIENPSSGLVVAVSSSGGQLQLEVGGGPENQFFRVFFWIFLLTGKSD